MNAMKMMRRCILAAVLLILSGCKASVAVKQDADGIRLQAITCREKELTLAAGETKDIRLESYPANSSIRLSEWTVSDPAVGRITPVQGQTNTYTVTAVGAGTAVLSAHDTANPAARIEIRLSVADAHAVQVRVQPVMMTLEAGKTADLHASVYPAAAVQKVKWESDQPDIVSVDANGSINAKQAGEAVIKAVSTADPSKYAVCSVRVPPQAKKIRLNKTVLELSYGTSEQLTAHLESNNSPANVQWQVSASDLIACSEDGLITALNKSGTAVVRAVSVNDSEAFAECMVVITPSKLARLIVNPPMAEIDLSGTAEFTVHAEPADAEIQLNYKIEGNGIELERLEKDTAAKCYRGTIKAADTAGSGRIIFRSETAPDISADLAVTITPQVKSISVENKTLNANVKGFIMTAAVVPDTAPQAVKWYSSNTDVAEIDEHTGTVTPHKAGDTVITAVSEKYPDKKGFGLLTIVENSTPFSVEISSATISYNSPALLTIYPDDVYTEAHFNVETHGSRLSITPIVGNPHQFRVAVNSKTAENGEEEITVVMNADGNIHKQRIPFYIESIIPSKLLIEGPFSMYRDEQVQFKVSAPAADINADTHVEWSVVQESSGGENPAFSITDEGQFSINPAYYARVPHGTSVRIRAVSTLTETVYAEHRITVYDAVAHISQVTCNVTEYILGKTPPPLITIKLGNEDTAYKHFIISEHNTGSEASAVLETTHYHADNLSNGLPLVLKAHTKGKPQTFFVRPVDPKTGKASGGMSFELTVWLDWEGMTLESGNIAVKSDSYWTFSVNDILTNGPHQEPYYFFVKVLPEYAKVYDLTVTKSPTYNDKLVTNIKTAFVGEGRYKVSFNTEPDTNEKRDILMMSMPGKRIDLTVKGKKA